MSVAALSFPKAFRVRFSKTERWNVSFFKVGSWHWEKGIIQPVTAFTNPVVEPLTFEEAQQQNIPIISKITFNGELVLKEASEYKDYKGRLFLVRPHTIIFSKINARRGCIFYAPEGHRVFAVSGEYPVLALDRNRVIGEYVNLALRVGPARESLMGGASGMAKARTYLEDFQKIKIPLPPLEIQERIVAAWQQAQEKAVQAQARVDELEKQFFSFVSERLGRKKSDSSRPKFFALLWHEIERWGVEIAWNTKNQQSGSRYPIRAIGELCKIGSGGTPSRERSNYFGGDILWVKTTEVRNEVIFDTEEKITELGLKNSSAKIYPAGSLIVAMYGQGATRGRTAKLGVPAATNQACAVLSNFSQDIEPDYLWYYLMSEYDNLRRQASGNNQPNLNAAMIANYPVPIPSLDIQNEIVRSVEEGRQKIRQEQEAAAKIAEEAQSDVERMILGLSKAESL